MSIKTLHKWLFSLTLLVSLVSFQGYATQSNKTLTTTQWIVSEHFVSEASANYLFFSTCKLILVPNSYSNFTFNSFVHTQEICYSIKYKVQNQTALLLGNLDSISQLKLISPVNTDVFIITS